MKIVKVSLAFLASPFGSTDTQFTVTSFKDSKGNAVSLSDFGTWLIVVLKSGETTELVKCDALQNNDDGTTTFGVATNGRDLDPTSPYAGSSIGQDFPAGSDALVSNDPYTMSKFVNTEENATLAGLIIFAQVPQTTAGDPISDNDLVRKKYADTIALGVLTQVNIKVPGTAGETIAAGQVVYFDDSSKKWKLARADQAATVNNVLIGIAQGAGVLSGAITNGVLIQGNDENQTSRTIGAKQYVSDTPGAISETPGTFEVCIGIGGRVTTEVSFFPRFDKVLTKAQTDALGLSSTAISTTNKLLDEASMTGTIIQYAGRTAPTGWLLCDGTLYSRSAYARLFGIISPSAVFTVTIATPGVFTKVAHGLVAGDKLHLTTTGALPTGLAANTDYYVISSGLTADAFKLALSPGGAAINTSGSQSGVHTLYASAWGKGDGSTTFAVPDLRGKVALGMAPTAGTVALSFEPAAVDTGNDWVTALDTVFPAQGQKIQLTTTGTLPAGLSLSTDYWIVRLTTTTFGFATTQANANAGTLINITDTGSGVHTLTYTGRTHTVLGRTGGEDTHGQSKGEIAAHVHSDIQLLSAPTGTSGAASSSAQTGGTTGANTPADGQHNNMQQFAVMNFIIKT